jgi:hypothetical protein
MTKIAGSGSASGSTPKCYGSGTLFPGYDFAPDPLQITFEEESPLFFVWNFPAKSRLLSATLRLKAMTDLRAPPAS